MSTGGFLEKRTETSLTFDNLEKRTGGELTMGVEECKYTLLGLLLSQQEKEAGSSLEPGISLAAVLGRGG